MNNGVLKLLSEARKRRIAKAEENHRNGVYDPLNSLVDMILKSDFFKKPKSKKRKAKL